MKTFSFQPLLTFGIFLLGAMLVCNAAPTAGPASAAEVSAQAGLGETDRVMLQSTADNLSGFGFSDSQIREMLAPAEKAAALGLPCDSILNKLKEGAAKGVEPPMLIQAAEARLGALKTGAKLAAQYRAVCNSAQCRQLEAALANAVESGMSPNALEAVVKQAPDAAPARLAAAVAAGEDLFLSGFSEEDASQFMVDCLDRKLRRGEMLRALRFAQDRFREGMDGKEALRLLWSSGGERGRMGTKTGTGQGQGQAWTGGGGQGSGPKGQGKPGRAGGGGGR